MGKKTEAKNITIVKAEPQKSFALNHAVVILSFLRGNETKSWHKD
jgi:hypothetical protein